MRDKIDLLSSALFSVVFVLVLLETGLRALGLIHHVPAFHKELLLTSLLLWVISLVAQRDSGDDWAGHV